MAQGLLPVTGENSKPIDGVHSVTPVALSTLTTVDAGGDKPINASQDEAVIASAAEGRELCIGNLAYATTEGELKDFFMDYLNPRQVTRLERYLQKAFGNGSTAHSDNALLTPFGTPDNAVKPDLETEKYFLVPEDRSAVSPKRPVKAFDLRTLAESTARLSACTARLERARKAYEEAVPTRRLFEEGIAYLNDVPTIWSFEERKAHWRKILENGGVLPRDQTDSRSSHAVHETGPTLSTTSSHDISSQNLPARGEPRMPQTSATLVYEPEILGFMNDQFIRAFPDNASARNIVSQDFVKRHRLHIDSSAEGKLQTATGSNVKTLGTVTVSFRFAGESEQYTQDFHVLPKCLYDVILGSPFLRMTKTFTHFTHRVGKKLRSVSSKFRVCFTGSTQQMLAGWADGESTLALPDTGSDVCLMSLEYAKARGYRIDTDHKHRKRLEFVDGSTAEALGRVEAFQWEFELSGSQVHYTDVYVLDGLQTDLLLSYDFLMKSDAFSAHEQLFVDTDQHEESVYGWMVSAIKLVRESKLWNVGQKVARKFGWEVPGYASQELSDLQKWQTRKRHASAMYEENCTAALALPEHHRSQALASARDEWAKFWNSWPGCGSGSRCTAQTPCRNGGCNFQPLIPSLLGNISPQSADPLQGPNIFHVPAGSTLGSAPSSTGSVMASGPSPLPLDPVILGNRSALVITQSPPTLGDDLTNVAMAGRTIN